MDGECDLTNRDPNNLNDHLAVSKRTVVLASVVWLLLVQLYINASTA